MRPRLLLALTLTFAATLVVPGCVSPISCPLVASSPGADPFCVVTTDGWALMGVQWNSSANRSVILVHGLNEDHHSYDALAGELAAEGWRVLAFDSRGMGLSTNLGNFRNFTPDDDLRLDRDLDAVRSLLPGPPAAVVGASVGASEALRWSDRADRPVPLVLLSPGLGYQDIPISDANAHHEGHVLFLASSGDSYSTRSIELLAPHHPGPKEVHILDGTEHGTQLLREPANRVSIEAWLDAA